MLAVHHRTFHQPHATAHAAGGGAGAPPSCRSAAVGTKDELRRRGSSSPSDNTANDHEPDLETKLIALRTRLRVYADPAARLRQPLNKPLGIEKIVSQTHRFIQGTVNTDRFGVVEFQTPLRCQAIQLAHYDPTVTMMISKPLALPWQDVEGNFHNHVCDYALLRGEDLVIMDVVDDRYEQGEMVLARRAAIAKTLRMHDVRYEVWTRSEIEREPRADNISLLDRGPGCVPTAAEEQIVLDAARHHPHGIAVSDLARRLTDPSAIYKVFSMVRRAQLILVEPDEPIFEHGLVIASAPA